MGSLNNLTDKQRVFVEEYLKDFNGARAAREAGYKFPRQSAYENLSKPYIRHVIESRLSLKAMSANEVLWRLGMQARGNISDFIDTDVRGGTVDMQALKEKGYLIESVSWTKQGLRLKMYDAQGALEKIGRAHGIFKNQLEHTGQININLKWGDGDEPDDNAP